MATGLSGLQCFGGILPDLSNAPFSMMYHEENVPLSP
jgi:hypothetical protein